MRFIENGPNIPDELLFAQDEGNVVFFCGAGVSMAHANLSSFAGLAQNVMDNLGATEESKAMQQFSLLKKLNENDHTRGLISADHIFSSLRRSFDHNDINCYIARSLKPLENPNLTAHKTILKLARLKGGQTRLITTNFDLLFEACDKKLKSVTRSNLPSIEYSDNAWGVVHLHGKVNFDYSGPDHDGFVLSSSEFGDAYLAQGWARDFVKSVLSKFVAVFIGYTADDPPVRYLLEGLQQGNNFKHKIYAFQLGPNDEAVIQWEEKGVKAIEYELDDARTHSPLWKTLVAWYDRSKDPTAWKKRVFFKARKGPLPLAPHERGMVAHLIKSPLGAKLLGEIDPPVPSEWLCVFDRSIRVRQSKSENHPYPQEKIITNYQPYALDDDPPPPGRNIEFKQVPSEAWDAFSLNDHDYEMLEDKHLPKIRGDRANEAGFLPNRLMYLARWICKVSEQKIAVWWAGQQFCLHPELLRIVKQNITNNRDKPLPDPIAKAWNTIFEMSYFSNRSNDEEYLLQEHIRVMGWSDFIIREYARVSASFLKRGTSYTCAIPIDKRKKTSSQVLINAEVLYPEGIYDITIPDEYVARVVNVQRNNLEKAIDMEQEFSGWLELCSIEGDEDLNELGNSRNYDLSGYVLYFSKLFCKLVEIDNEAARTEYFRWRKTDPIFIRLRVWASGLKNVTTESEFANVIISLKHEDFWSFKGARDLLLALRNRWDELSAENRMLIEKKILKGPPKYKTITKAEHIINSAHNRLNRLYWLKNQGCNFSFDFKKMTERLSKEAPEWNLEYAAKAADSNDMRSGNVTIDTEWSSLKTLPLSKIIETAQKISRRDFGQLVEFSPFSGLCDDAPLKALRALALNLKKGIFSCDFWKIYLSRERRKEDCYRLKLLTAGRLAQIPNENFKSILLTVSLWFKKVGPELRADNAKVFETIWVKFIETMTLHEFSSGSALVRREEKVIDWIGEAINSPSGNLAELHMIDPIKDNLKPGKGYPKSWISKTNQLLDLPDDSHRYAMVIFAFNFSWFYTFDPKWTENKLLKIIEDKDSDKDDKDAIWAGFLWGARTPPAELYIKLKPHLLEMANERSSERRKHVEILSGILLSGWGVKNNKNQRLVTDEELHAVLLNADDNFRSHILWHLKRWSQGKENDWNKDLLQFLQKIWPKHKKVKSSKTSARLFDIALTQKDNFSAISKQVVQLVSKIGNEHIYSAMIRKSGSNKEENGDNLAFAYPKEFLNLLYAILPDQAERWPYGTSDALKLIEKAAPKLINDYKFIELKSRLTDF